MLWRVIKKVLEQTKMEAKDSEDSACHKRIVDSEERTVIGYRPEATSDKINNSKTKTIAIRNNFLSLV